MTRKTVIKSMKNKRFDSIIKKFVLVIATISILSCFPVISANHQEIMTSTEDSQIDPSVEDFVLVDLETVVLGEDNNGGTNPLSSPSPPVTIDIKVRENDDDEWVTSYTAPVGTVLQFKIAAKNNKFFPRFVIIVNTLPDILDYIEGSANHEPDEYFNDSEEVITWLKTIAGLTTLTIKYKAKIVAVGEGENYVIVTPPTEESDDDSVTITGTSNPPYQPSNPDPSDDETDVDVDHDLYWDGGDPNAGENVTYDIYFDDTSPPEYYDTTGPFPANQTNISFDPGEMEPNTVYYWKIVAEDNYGVNSTSDNWSFTTENNPPNIPSNPDPVDGETNVSVDADLSWTGGDPDPGDTVTYDVYFGTTSTPPKVADNITDTTYELDSMEEDTQYFWKIVSWDNQGASTEGPVWDFTTLEGEPQNNPPYEPSDPSPVDGETNVSVDVDLSWTGGDPDPGDTVTYDVYFGTTSTPPKVADNITDSTYDLDPLEKDTQYFWKIVVWDNHGASTEGQEWDFTTTEPVTGADLKCNGNLVWTNVAPGETVEGSFTVENVGEPGSLLDWDVVQYPDWGTWTFTPSNGDDLKPEDGPITVKVSIKAPENKNQVYAGKVKIVNKENPSDSCNIDASLSMPKNKVFNIYLNFLNWLFERFPNVFPVLRQLLGL